MDEPAARERFRSLLARPDAEVPLAECALTFAAEACPGLDIAAYLARLDALAEALRRRHRPDMSAADTIVVLNRYLFDELGFAANAQDYYDPRNSYLNEVLDRRIGIPITLSVVYLEIGRRLGLALDGVSFPGHFLVKCALKEGTVVIDPYLKGASLGVDDLTKRLRALQGGAVQRPPVSALLAAASSREIIVRMLRNLKVIHLEAKAWREALWTLDYQLIAAPGAVEAYRERGNVYLEMECFRAALGDFEHYLKLAADAEDAAEIRIRVAELKRVAARLN
jgi:regulator of sirC expression with transglutaminase-like and TPR domain